MSLHVLGKVGKNSLPRFPHQVLDICTDSFGQILLFEGLEEASLDGIPACSISSEHLQAVPSGLGLASDNASQLLNLASVVPAGDGNGNVLF
jgi:hypothetical protein